MFAADVDGDGDLDVLSRLPIDDKIAWYENDGSRNFGGREHTSARRPTGRGACFAADVDGDGDWTCSARPRTTTTIAWYENGRQRNFGPHTISTGGRRGVSVFAADVDGDGDLDVLSRLAS